MTAPALTAFPALDGLPVTRAHTDQCAQFGHATGGADSDTCPRCGDTAEAPTVEANLCNGTFVLGVVGRFGQMTYRQCPGCIGCDYDTVAARMAAKAPADPFARLPKIDDEEW